MSKRDQMALDAYRDPESEVYRDKVGAYRLAYPIAQKWADTTVLAKMESLLRSVGTPGPMPQFDAEMLQRAREYLEQYSALGDAVPDVSGLAVELGKCRSTLYNWSNQYPEFREVMSRLQDIQRRVLINKGLTSDFSSVIAKLMLHNQDLTDRVETNHRSSDGSMTPQIDVHMDPDEAARLYREKLK